MQIQKRKKKKSQIKGKQLHLWMFEVIDHILFQFNIVPQAGEGGGGVQATLVRLDKIQFYFGDMTD